MPLKRRYGDYGRRKNCQQSDHRRRRVGGHSPSAVHGGLCRTGQDQEESGDLHLRGKGEGRGARPCPSLRTSRAWQDHARARHRQRARRADQSDVGSCHRASRRPCRHPHQPREGGHPLHRRDPPSQPQHRGSALSRHGGLLAGHRLRQRSHGEEHTHTAEEIYAHRRDHPRGDALEPPPRQVRHAHAP